jgi:transposase InsO family protein
MRAEGLQGAIRGRKRRTTVPGGQAERPGDLVERNFNASAPNRLWVSDFTYVATWSGVIYVAFAIDAFSRRIVGWKVDSTMKTPLVLDTLEMALWARDHHGQPVSEGLVLHSDAGSQFHELCLHSAAHRRRRRSLDRVRRRRLRQRARRDHDRALQDRADPPPRAVEDTRPSRACDPRVGRLVKPQTTPQRVRRTPSRRV